MRKLLLATVAALPLLGVGIMPADSQAVKKEGVTKSEKPAVSSASRSEPQGKGAQAKPELGSRTTQSSGAHQNAESHVSVSREAKSVGQSQVKSGTKTALKTESRITHGKDRSSGQAKLERDKHEASAGVRSHLSETESKGKRASEKLTTHTQLETSRTTGQTTTSSRLNGHLQANNEHLQRNGQDEKRGGKVGGRVTLSADERTKVQRSLLAGRDVPRVEHARFSVAVGTVVPREIRIAAVPSVLFEIDPEWRGYDYCVVDDDIVIIDHSRRIIALVPVGSSVASSADADSGDIDIRTVQEILIELGFYHGRVDGRLGVETRQALIRFQERERLAASGHVDVRTLRALEASRHSASRERPEQKEVKGETGRGRSSGEGLQTRESRHANGENNNAKIERSNHLSSSDQGRKQSSTLEHKATTVGQSTHSQDQSAKPGNGASETRRKHTY